MSRLAPQIRWWPEYVYHATDIRNAAGIITHGALLSRRKATELNLMMVDNASPNVISRTAPQYQSYARLYFRPRTPTQYHSEGLRPESERMQSLGRPHCPVPVFFVFSAYDVLSLDVTEFSNGNLASTNVVRGSNLDFFQSIPFEQVFHDRAHDPGDHAITFHRCAEVLIPNELSLDPYLRFVVCRSEPERQTLLHLLPPRTAVAWQTKIKLAESGDYYFRQFTYVEEVHIPADVDTGSVIFRFNPSSRTRGPTRIDFEYVEAGSRQVHRWSGSRPDLRHDLVIRLPRANSGVVTLRLDGDLAYSAHQYFGEIPF